MDVLTILSSPADALALCTRIAAAALLLITCQWLWNWRLLRTDNLLGWNLLRKRRGFTQRGAVAGLCGALLEFPQFLVLLALSAAAAAFLIVRPIQNDLSPYVLTLIVGVSMLRHLRFFPYGATGSDRMVFLVFGSLWILQLAPEAVLAQQACLWFLALQVTLSYSTAGLCKLVSADWRHGLGFSRVCRNPFFVTQPVAAVLLGNSGIMVGLNWGAMLWQLTFPAFFFIEWPWCAVFLLIGILFHVLNGVILGLNTFILAWPSTYPALIYCRLQLNVHVFP